MQVTFVEVSPQFLPDDCLGAPEFNVLNHQYAETAYEWVPSDQGPEVGLLELQNIESLPGSLQRTDFGRRTSPILGEFPAVNPPSWSIRAWFSSRVDQVTNPTCSQKDQRELGYRPRVRADIEFGIKVERPTD